AARARRPVAARASPLDLPRQVGARGARRAGSSSAPGHASGKGTPPPACALVRSSSLPPMIVALAGGVGSARFLAGLLEVVDPRDVVIIGNTGDDDWFHGLRVCPDLD